jgi:hypothetical protein
MDKKPSKMHKQLTAKLQRDIPKFAGKAITWSPEDIYRRSILQLKRDGEYTLGYSYIARATWTATGRFACLFDCRHTMQQCLKAKRLYNIKYDIEIVE